MDSDLAAQLRQNISLQMHNKKKEIKRLHLVEAFRTGGIHPSWMILDVIPVLPPELRPLVPLESGRFANCDMEIVL